MGESKAEGIKINDFEILIYDMIGLKNISYRGENVNEDIIVKTYNQNVKNHLIWNLEDEKGLRINSGGYYLKVDNGRN